MDLDDFLKLQIGDRIEFRAATRHNARKQIRKITGFPKTYDDVETWGHRSREFVLVRFEGSPNFYVRRSEVIRRVEAAQSETLRIPRGFFDDHKERDLATPVVVQESQTTVWISRRDPALPELIEDAQYYAETFEGWTDDAHRFVRMARSLLSSLNRQGVTA